MSNFIPVSRHLYLGKTPHIMKKLTTAQRLFYVYLLTNGDINNLGIYQLNLLAGGSRLNLTLEEVTEALEKLKSINFCAYDELNSYIWIKSYFYQQIEELNLTPTNKMTRGLQKIFSHLPNLEFLPEFFEVYKDVSPFELTCNRYLSSPPEGLLIPHDASPPEGLLSLNDASPYEGESKCDFNVRPKSKSKSKSKSNCERGIFDHWCTVMKKKKAALDDKRLGTIQKALKLGYSEEDLCSAIEGCAKSSFHMGFNDQSKIYNDIGLILRDAQRIEHFMEINQTTEELTPPKSPSQRKSEEFNSMVNEVIETYNTNEYEQDGVIEHEPESEVGEISIENI